MVCDHKWNPVVILPLLLGESFTSEHNSCLTYLFLNKLVMVPPFLLKSYTNLHPTFFEHIFLNLKACAYRIPYLLGATKNFTSMERV